MTGPRALESTVAPKDESTRSAEFQLAQVGPEGVRWLLKRNCALTPRQCLIAFGLASGVALLVASFFWAIGVRMVLPFAVLELSALGLAFLWYARHATDREVLMLDARRLVVEWEQGGAVERRELARPWLRVADLPHDRALVELRAGSARVQVGRYARPEQRRQLARELRRALQGERFEPAG